MLTSNVNLKEDDDQANSFLNQNIIRKTRKIISNMTEKQKFQKAKAHIIDSLNYKHPRFESQSLETPLLFKLWEWMLFILGYVYMYLVILDSESYVEKIVVEALVLVIFWLDNIFLFYCKSFDKTKYSSFFIFKNILIVLMTIDLIVFISYPCFDCRPVRPFRILRAFIPILFDPELRKSLFSLASAYKDVLVYIVFYSFIIVGWALIGCKTLTFDPTYKNPDYIQYMDPYKNNYSNLGSMIFVVYVTATYDSFPDNQMLAMQNNEANFIYFVVFVFLNMFIFSSIPGSLIYIKFRQTRSKIILIDEIKQQHSLLLAFVTLAQNEKDLSIEKLVKFLLFLYKFKIRYIEYITDICLRLDDNNNKSIQVNEFMQLSKILLQNSAMLPPSFEDIQLWIDFRKFFNSKLHLKEVIQHILFQLIITILIILSFINTIFLIFYGSQIASTFDTIFIFIFLAELIIRIIAIGPQNFFNDRWNNVDTALVLFGLVFFFLPNNNTGAGSISRMSRIFRIASLLRLVSHSNYLKKVRLQIFQKFKNIFSILLEIFPIIFKFFPIFLVFFYIFSIFGMQVFYDSYELSGNPAYTNYIEFATFRNIFYAHLIMVQVLTEAGWSQVAFDLGWRNPQYYAYVMLYFILMHLVITYIVATLIRGIFWEVFFTVNSIIEQRRREGILQETKEEQNIEKTAEFNQINQLIGKNRYIVPNTIIKRNLVQSKRDLQIFKRLRLTYLDPSTSGKLGSKKQVHRNRNKRSMMVQKMIDDWNINIKDLEVSENIKQRYIEKNRSDGSRFGQQSDQSLENTRKLSINDIEQVDEQDFESEFQDLLDGLIISPKVLFNEIIAYPKIFVDFLNQKMVKPETLIDQFDFDLSLNPLYNQQSMYYHIYQIHAILGIETSKRQQKAMIIESLYEQNIITEETVQKLIKKKLQEKVFNVDTNGTLRNLFLSETNQQLIKKFEVQYFSDLYGYSFKHINKLTLQPLIKFQATLTYSLRNILRYPQIDNTQFFEMFTHIQDKISNRLLKRGSLFKFVYKIDHQSDIWFSIQYKKQQEMRVHFIKTGIWAYTKDMVQQQVYYARDMFNWDTKNRADSKACEQYLKRFYQSFEGLAFSLLDENQFFRTNPVEYVYDLYIQFFDVQKINRYVAKKLQISKIMVVILSKEQERKDIGIPPLQYSVSDIIVPQKLRQKKHKDFTFDQSDNETYEKLKNIAALDVQKIVQSQGLPFSYVVNLMKQISDILKISSQNFIFQIEKVLNDQYEEVNMDKKYEQKSPV